MTGGPSMPTVELVAATEWDPADAAALLIFTKSTRLKMSTEGLEGVRRRCHNEPEWMASELGYMARTIRSSWEFLDLTFMISNVSRACAQQITRTRFTPIDGDLYGSYAMQSQRVTDLSGATYHTPEHLQGRERERYENAMNAALTRYEAMIEQVGLKPEDARGVLPLNVHCNLVAKYNLRTLVDLVGARTSYRVQSEYQCIAEQMRSLTIELWPWAELFFKPRNQIACDLLDELDAVIQDPVKGTVKDLRTLVAKVRDQLEGK